MSPRGLRAALDTDAAAAFRQIGAEGILDDTHKQALRAALERYVKPWLPGPPPATVEPA